MRLRTAAAALAVLALSALPASAALAAPAGTHPAAHAAPVTSRPAHAASASPKGLGTTCSVSCSVFNDYGYIKWNSTAGTYRLASGVWSVFNVEYFAGPPVYVQLLDTSDGTCVGWVSGTGITQVTCGLSRSKWDAAQCSAGTSMTNEYAKSLGDNDVLTGSGTGPLYLNPQGQCGDYTGWNS